MANTREEALSALSAYVSSYMQGLHKETGTGKEYADKLKGIKTAYYWVERLKGSANQEPDVISERNGLIAAVIALVGWAVCYLMMPDKMGVHAVFLILLCIAAKLTTQDDILSWVPICVYVAGSFFGLNKYFVLVHILLIAGHSLLHMTRKKRDAQSITDRYNTNRENLNRLQRELNGLLPRIRQELQEYADQWREDNEAVLQEEDRFDFLGEDFPAAFWWQVTEEELNRLDQIFTCNRYGSWETKLVSREPGGEFEALEEYDPLFAQSELTEGKASDYFPADQGFVIYDIVSRLTVVSARTETVQYEVPAHSSLERMAVNMGVLSLAHETDQAYNEGQISSAEHKRLANEVFGLSLLAADYSNATKSETMNEYIPVHAHTNIWTGQIVLKKYEEGGDVLYGLQCYSCQLPHLMENLEAMRSLPIAYIKFDFWNCNPYFLAKFYSRFPQAM